MAIFDNITMDITDKLTVKRWSEDVSTQAMNALSFADLIGSGERYAINKDSTLSRGMGDTITFPYRLQSFDEGLSANQTILGNEAKVEYAYDQLSIDRKSFQWIAPTKSTIQQQKVPMKLINDAQDFVAISFSKYISATFFAQLAGNASATIYNGTSIITISDAQLPSWQGFNPILKPTRIWKINGSAAPTAKDYLKLSDLDDIKAQAETPMDGSPVIRKLNLKGGRVEYIVFIHPKQASIMRRDPAVGELQDLSKFFQMGTEDKGDYWKGYGNNNGVIGIYNGIEIRVSPYVPLSGNGKTATACLIGAQAMFFGLGETAESQAPAVEETKNPLYLEMADYLYPYGDQHGFAGKCILGMKKAQYKTDKAELTDNAVITIPSYADKTTADFSGEKGGGEGGAQMAITPEALQAFVSMALPPANAAAQAEQMTPQQKAAATRAANNG